MPTVVRCYVTWITRCNHLLFRVAAALMVIIVPVMLYEVTSRYLFNAPTTWGMELALLLFGPYFLLGGPYLLHLKGHVNLDVVRQRMPPGPGRLLDLFNQIIIMLFCAILFYYAWPLAIQSLEFRETSFSAWNPPIWPFKFTIPVAVVLLGAQSLAEFLRIFFRDPSLSGSPL